MGRMIEACVRRTRIARGNSAIDMIREFGSVRAAREWLEQQAFWQEMADRIDVELLPAPEPLSHKQWRADQAEAGMPQPMSGRRIV